MDEQRLRAELRARDRATRPDDQFSDQLFARLATELRLRPAPETTVGRPARSARRWLPAIALALLTVATMGALAFLARPDDEQLMCGPELAAVAAQRLRDSAGYTYSIGGSIHTVPLFVQGETDADRARPHELRIEGEVAADRMRERYLAGGELALGSHRDYPLIDEAIQVGETLWVRDHMSTDPNLPWRQLDENSSELSAALVVLPNLVLNMANRLPLMIEGPAGAPSSAWAVVDGDAQPERASCTLRDERRWAEQNDARRIVTLEVDLESGLPASISEIWDGFRYMSTDEPSLDRQLNVSIAYPEETPVIAPPPPGEVAPDPFLGPHGVESPEPLQTVIAPGEITVEDDDGPLVKVTFTEVVERRSHGDSVAVPGNVYLSVYARYESLRESSEFWVPYFYWRVLPHGRGVRPEERVGLVEPPLGSSRSQAVGQVLEGWVTYEVLAEGEIAMDWATPVGPTYDTPARVILREDRPAAEEESPTSVVGRYTRPESAVSDRRP